MSIQENRQPLFDDETNNSSIDDFDEEMVDLVDDEQKKLFLQNKVTIVENLMDNRLQYFVQLEGPNQIMNLILEKQSQIMLCLEFFFIKKILKTGCGVYFN